MNKLDTNEFIKRAKTIHGLYYDYSLVEYTNSHNRVIIICPKHGKIEILPFNHINNKRGCKQCGLEKTHNKNKVTIEDFISKCNKLKEYTYKELTFNCLTDDIALICPRHGEFITKPKYLLRNSGCLQCKFEKRRSNFSNFVEKAKLFHQEVYDYSLVEYKTSHDDIKLICKKHGEFYIKAYIHIQGGGCPLCTRYVSKKEFEICNFLKSLDISNVIQSYRKFHGIREIDIYLPENKLAIEYNGLYWHSNLFKENNYHLNKTEKLDALNIRLIHIFDDEWQNKKDICKSRIANILGKTKNKIFARNTKLEEISASMTKEFLEKNHLQGNVFGRIRLALIYKGEIVSVMTFGNFRKNMGRNKQQDCYEMLRFCCKINTQVIGGASKLFTNFIRKYNPLKIISYADRRWSIGDIYKNLGFKFVKTTAPNYFYTDGSLKRFNRFSLRKQKLVELGYDKNLSENEITKSMGLLRVYDCGVKLYEWKKE